MKNYLLLLALAGAFTFTSCDNDDDEKEPNKTSMLTSGAWKLTSSTVNPAIDFDGNGTKETDLTQFISPCSLDDITLYKSDNTYTEEEGPSKCDPDDEQIFATGTWTFTNNETELSTTETGSASPDTYKIIELTSNTLKLSNTFVDSSTTYTLTRVWQH